MRVCGIVGLLLSSLSSLYAQNYFDEEPTSKKTVFILPRFGLSYSKAGYENYFPPGNISYTQGITAGLGLEFRLTNKLNLLTEISFVNKGFYFYGSMPLSTDILENKTTDTYNYVELPFLARKRFGTGIVKPYINAGLFVAFCLEGTHHIASSLHPPGVDFATMATEHSQSIAFGKPPSGAYYIKSRFDAGCSIGAGLIVADLIVLDARYSQGLINLHDYTSKNQTFTVSIGFQFSSEY